MMIKENKTAVWQTSLGIRGLYTLPCLIDLSKICLFCKNYMNLAVISVSCQNLESDENSLHKGGQKTLEVKFKF